MKKVILVMIDAQGFETAVQRAGFLEHLCEVGLAAKYRVACGLPSSSRPMYETILTGLPVSEHGIYSNQTVRRSTSENLFALTRRHGKTNAAAAYGWVSELYTDHAPFDVFRDRMQLDGSGDIDHGIFYIEDTYPDSHLYADGEMLRQMYHPDFLLIHPMNVDDMGHRHTAASREYGHASEVSFDQIAILFDRWREDGYDLLVTGDHGMDLLGMHGGNEAIQREVPLYIVSDAAEPGDYTDHAISNLNLAPFICDLLEIPRGEHMISALEIVPKGGASK
ncbi:MAG TPA: alkaline phosphatase family protein [Butyricicoccus pullicaecorum]|nr:alkaline phosphatase family protein [Butyricicoccus pullicaecorum]